jgi:ubiquinone/menaquinone biosynthesis C-methylase UbiE
MIRRENHAISRKAERRLNKMGTQGLVSYEDSVNWIRGQEQYADLVNCCYLDRDNLEAAKRFTASEEFIEVSQLLKLKNRLTSVQVLDLGCGNGIASYAFSSLGCAVTAVDPNTSDDVGLMAAARLRNHISNGSITTMQATAESLTFSDNTFDIIYERQALHHFSNLVQGLSECARVLKPGGSFLATREHVINDSRQLEQFLAEHILHQKHGGENAYQLSHYTKSLRQAGFTIIRTIGPMDSAINHWPSSNSDVAQAMSNWLISHLGHTLGNSLAKISFSEKAYRRFKSMREKSPGRLYSFLCTK